MGLDMYLTARKHVNRWNAEDPEQKGLSEVPVSGAQGMPVSGIEYGAAYWRKANAIHKWFVENVQNGVDDCNDYEVSAEQLAELLGLCRLVLHDKSIASRTLPTADGFFFGDTEYGEGYIADLEYTIEALDKLLSAPRDYKWSFSYSSSW